MSETKWSPEPWEYEGNDNGDGSLDVTHTRWFDGGEVPKTPVAQFCDPEDARRIVACVNACAGIPTEALEDGCIGALLDVRRAASRAWVQRDGDSMILLGRAILCRALGRLK